MRFLMATTFYPPHHFGGDAIYVRQLTEALRARGHSVDVVYCRDSYRISGGRNEGEGEAHSKSGDILQLESPFGGLSPLLTQMTGRPLLKGAQLKEIFNRPYDVVNFHNLSLIGGPGILSMSKARLTLFTAHEHWTVCPTHILWKNRSKACDKRQCFTCQLRSGRPPQLWRYTNLLKSGFEAVDQIFAPSAFTKRKLETGGIERPISVLRLFAPPDFEELAPAGPALAAPTFIYVGRITRSKGILELISAFSQRPNYKLQIVGDGDLMASMAAATRGLDNIELLGGQPRSALPKLYRRATAFILPSLAPESFGLATVEAFAQGTPAIVRDAGGAGEVVRESGAGIVFKTDKEALTAIDRLAEDRALRDRLGDKARQSFLKLYTEQRHVDAYLKHVEDLLVNGAGDAK
jgi:glycosyltransferase involved in cell wall biosynthesis